MAAAKGKAIKVKAKLEVWELTPPKIRQKILGKEFNLKFKPIELNDTINVVNKDFKDMTAKSFPDDMKGALKLDLAIFHVRAEQELAKVEKAKTEKDKEKAKKNLKQVMEKTAKDLHKKARETLDGIKETAGKESKKSDLPKDAGKSMKGIEHAIENLNDDFSEMQDGFVRAREAISANPEMANPEKAKHLKPLNALVTSFVKSQNKLLDTLKKGKGMTSGVDAKGGDKIAKNLAKTGKSMDVAAKKYKAFASTSEKKIGVVLTNLKANGYPTEDALTKELEKAHIHPAMENLMDSYWDLNDDMRKAAKAK